MAVIRREFPFAVEVVDPYWAGFGIACCRVDLRGAGDSNGLLANEYLPRRNAKRCTTARRI